MPDTDKFHQRQIIAVTGVNFPDGTTQTTAASAATSAPVLDVGTAAGTAPSPLYSPSEAPSGLNPNIYIQDVNGAWHAQAGVDTTTANVSGSGPLDPQGTLTFTRRVFARDTLATSQSFKNSFVSINHGAGINTSSTNQDRALGLAMGNISASIQSWSITSNVVTFNFNNLLGSFGTPFQPGMLVKPSGLTTGSFLNGQTLTVATVVTLGGGSFQLTAPFTHADVGTTAEAGKLDQLLYSMACLQAEVDIFGTPSVQAGTDTEFRALSLQVSDNVVGTPSAPADGVGCARLQYFRQAGQAGWGSVDPSCLLVKCTNNSTVNAGGMFINGIQVQVDSTGVSPSGTNMRAIWIQPPNASFRFGNNWGLVVDNFGTNVNDFAIKVGGGNTALFGVGTAIATKTANYTVTNSDHTILCNGTFTVTLPTNLPAGQTYVIKTIAAAQTVTISSAVNIDGATSTTLTTQYSKITVQWDGTQWWTVA